MKRAILTRRATGPQGTLGDLVVYNENGRVILELVTLELAWHENEPGRSCVPEWEGGVYFRTDSPAHGQVYELMSVPGRTVCQIHAANLAGDVELGYVKQLDGCIAPGLAVVKFKAGNKPAGEKDQVGVSGSKAAVAKLVEVLNKETFQLKIVWAPNLGPKEESHHG